MFSEKRQCSYVCLPTLYSFIFHHMEAGFIFQLIRTFEKYFSKVSRVSLQSFKVIERQLVLESVVFHAFIYKSKWPDILANSTCKGERKRPVSFSLSCLKWWRMNAIWQSHWLRSSSPLGTFSFIPVFAIFISVNILWFKQLRCALFLPTEEVQ